MRAFLHMIRRAASLRRSSSVSCGGLGGRVNRRQKFMRANL